MRALLTIPLLSVPLLSVSFSTQAATPCVNPVRIEIAETGAGATLTMEPDLGFNDPVEVTWRGDADGDGAEDLIIRFRECSGYGECIFALFVACSGADHYATLWGPDYGLSVSLVADPGAHPLDTSVTPDAADRRLGVQVAHRMGYMAEEKIETITYWHVGNGRWERGHREARPNR